MATPSSTPPSIPSTTPRLNPSSTPPSIPSTTPRLNPSTTPQLNPSSTPQLNPSTTPTNISVYNKLYQDMYNYSIIFLSQKEKEYREKIEKMFFDQIGQDGIQYEINSPSTNIYQNNFTGTSNVYTPYVYYNRNESTDMQVEKFVPNIYGIDKYYVL